MPKNKNKNGDKKDPPLEISKKNINRKLGNCMKKYKIMNPKLQSNYTYNSKEEYDKSFKDEKILEFSKKIKDSDKKSINYVIYNNGNADGLFCAYVAWRYLYLDNSIDFIRFDPKPPPREGGIDKRIKTEDISGKNVLIVDISYNKETINEITKHAKSIILIDDHIATKVSDTSKKFEQFVGKVHGACAYTWKFFYPNEEIPEVIQTIDIQDRPLTLSYIPFPQLIKSSIDFRFVHNKTSGFHKQKFDFKNGMFPQLHDIVVMNDVNFYIAIGKYFEEVTENIKEQIAQNAQLATFQGHPVAVLNHIDPVMVKKIRRQIFTNFKEKGVKIDFVVMWSFQYSNGYYNIQMGEYEDGPNPPQFDIPGMVNKLKKISGLSGGGSQYIGNFYWPRNKKMDIWDLFEKKYI
jgi:hypothetical protein